jgi:antagonist of KipI
VTGGFNATALLGSCASHLAAAIGPGPVYREQALAVNPASESAAAIRAALSESDADARTWSVATTVPHSWPIIEVAALAGRHFNQLSEEDQRRLLDQGWVVSSSSNRQGLSLKGECLTTTLPNILSEPVREGTVQLPPSGLPIVLLAEHQSTGGYPRVLEVLSTEREVLGQAGPSARIVFRLVSLDQADQIQVRRRRSIAALRDAIMSKLQTL